MTPPPAGGDPFIYHLAFPASWLKHGGIFYVPLPYGAQAATYYPLNMELFYLWNMVPWHEDFLVNLGQVPVWIACGLGIAGLARSTGIGKPGAIIGGIFGMLIPGLIQQATVARVDIAFSAWLILSLYFVSRWGDTGRPGHLVLFGAALGLLIGTKSIGTIYCLLPLLLFLFKVAKRGKKAPGDMMVVAITALICGGFWYVRNWINTGNPFFPLDVHFFGKTIFPGAYGKEAMKAFHVTDSAELQKIGLFFLNIWFLIYLMVTASLAVILVLTRKRKGGGKMFFLAAPWLIIALFWYINPHNDLTNGRFLFPAFLLLCYSAALVLDDMCEIWTYIWIVAGAAAVFGSGIMHDTDHLLRLLRDIARAAIGAGDGILMPAVPAIRLLLAGAILFLSALAVRKKKKARGILTAAAGCFLIAGLFFSWNYHISHKYDWYKMFDEGAAWARLDEITKGKSLRIASVGNERIYGLFGTGFRNDVFSVSITPYTTNDFHFYWKRARAAGRTPSKSERPQWHRENASPEAWIRNLRKQKIDLVFATVLDPISTASMDHDEYGFPVEVGWADANPRLFLRKYSSARVRIYEIRPE